MAWRNKFCAAVFRLLLFTYSVSLLCLFLHIPKFLCSVEGCWLDNIYRQVRALKIDASLCKVWRIFSVIDVTCITCFGVCESMHAGDNTKQLRNWIVLHLRSCMWNNSFWGQLLLDTIRHSHGSHVRFVMLGLRVIFRIHRAVLLVILFIASFDSREEVRYFLFSRASTQALGPTRPLLGAQGPFLPRVKWSRREADHALSNADVTYDWNCTCFPHTIRTQTAFNPWLYTCHMSSVSLSVLGYFFLNQDSSLTLWRLK